MKNDFNLCPMCGSKTIQNKNDRRWFCPDCGFDLYCNIAAAVGVIIQDSKHNILFEVRAKNPRKGYVAFPGGFIDADESAEEAVERECMEEIGVEVESQELFDATATNIKWQMTEDTIEDLHHIGILFKVKLKSHNLKEDADGLDSLGAEWKEIDSLTEETTSPFTWYALKKLGYK